MKLAFSGEAHYPDFSAGYQLYSRRVRSRVPMGFGVYKRVVRMYCASLAERLYDNGMVDLPSKLGQIYAAEITRKPQYRGKQFLGYGMKDWKAGHYDGNMKAFGVVFLPNRMKKASLRCYGFVANRQLFKRLKSRYEDYYCPWAPLEFNDEMV